MPATSCNRDDDETRAKRDTTLVDAHCGQLLEHFDTVQIICTRHESPNGGSMMVSRGIGNYYARRGSCIEWIDSTKEHTFKASE